MDRSRYLLEIVGLYFAGAVRSGSCNGDPDTVETFMSPLDLVKRATLRKQRLSEAQLAHLRATAYRGVDTSAHLSPTIARASWSIDCCDGNNG